MRTPTSLFGRLLWAAVFLLLGSSHGSSQQTSTVASRGCRAADFDTHFQLISRPTEDFTISFDMRNISGQACTLDRGSYGTNGSPTFPDRTAPWGKVFVLSPDSTDRVWGTGKVVETAAILEPSKSAYFTIRWSTKPTKEGDPCIQPVAVSWPVLIVAPALIKPLCSEIEVSSFVFNPTSAEVKTETAPGSSPRILALASRQSTYYGDEEPLLHVSLPTDDASISGGKNTGPIVYLRQRSPDGSTEFRAASPLPHSGCEPIVHGLIRTAPMFEEIDWKKGFDLDPDFCGSVVRPKRRGEYTFEVFRAIPSSGSALRFVRSNVLHIQFDNAAPLQRNLTVR